MRIEAERFWNQALSEMADLRALYTMGRWAKACFCAEQAAQMALKAALIESTGRPHPQIHHLLKLAAPLSPPQEIAGLLEFLNKLYMGTRYPDVAPPPHPLDENASERAFREAADVLDWAASHLGIDPPHLRLH